MVMMALCSRFTRRRRVDKNGATALPVERTSAWSSLDQRFVHCLSTRSALVEIRIVDTTWIRRSSTLAASSNRRGSHSTRSGRTSKLHITPAKSHANEVSANQTSALFVLVCFGLDALARGETCAGAQYQR